MSNIIKIVSGGQTGADRGGLNASMKLGVPHGGWCPKGRLSEDGTIPVKYNLIEMKNKNYLKRTEQNVIDSDATIILTYGVAKGGSKRTVDFAIKHNKYYLSVDLNQEDSVILDNIINWLNSLEGDFVLNIAGSRESKNVGIELKVEEIMIKTFEKINE